MNHPSPVTDDDVLAALEAAIEDGEALQGGGVTTKAVAERLPIGHSATGDRLRKLWEDGHVNRGWGVPPEGGPKRTYTPAASED